MKLRMPTFDVDEQARRAIRFTSDGRKTQCTREEAAKFVNEAVQEKLVHARYRFRVGQGEDPDAVKKDLGLES